MTTGPRIGICASPRRLDLPFASVAAHTVFAAYVDAVAATGAVPIVLPCMAASWAEPLLGGVDGLILTGGPDVDARHYGGAHQGESSLERDAAEIALVHAAAELHRPVLGVCRGLQVVNVALGGSLVPHVEGHVGPAVRHRVDLDPTSRLAEAAGLRELDTGSLHHQAAASIGAGLRVTGRAADGTVEVLEGDGPAPILAVQWHPELDTGPAASAPFAWLAATAGAR